MESEKLTLSLDADDMVFYGENYKDYTHTPVRIKKEREREISKVAGYKITHKRSVTFYTWTMKDMTRTLRKQFHIQEY